TKDQLLKDGFVVNTILKEADLFCPNSVRINFTIYLLLYTLMIAFKKTFINVQKTPINVKKSELSPELNPTLIY
ncbi:hypothetical protein ACW9VW_11325, partial [Lactiplantibacillus plantarum]